MIWYLICCNDMQWYDMSMCSYSHDDMDLRYIWENGPAVQENPPKGINTVDSKDKFDVPKSFALSHPAAIRMMHYAGCLQETVSPDCRRQNQSSPWTQDRDMPSTQCQAETGRPSTGQMLPCVWMGKHPRPERTVMAVCNAVAISTYFKGRCMHIRARVPMSTCVYYSVLMHMWLYFLNVYIYIHCYR